MLFQKKPTTKKVRRAGTKETIDKIFKRFPASHSAHILLQLGYRCGIRLGEVFGLTWDDVNFKDHTITVNRQVQHNGVNWYLTAPKYNSIRAFKIVYHLSTKVKII